MYPILIIIFSVLIIFAIINNRQNNKLNAGIEKYMNLFENNESILKLGAATNTKFTKELIVGNWTCDKTTVDANYIASGFININLNPSDTTNPIPSTYGTLTYNSNNYRINFILNENLTAIQQTSTGTDTNNTMHIKFYNNFVDEENDNINPVFYAPETFNSVVSLLSGNILITKFASYKVYPDASGNNTIGNELYRIVKSNDIFIDKPKPIYDYNAYNAIIGSYKLPTNYLSYTFGSSNSNVLNTINTKYQGSIQFCIQRVFNSPANTNNEIITNISPRLALNSISNGQIPTTITVCSFADDQKANNLTSFFTPKATILYFYKATTINTTYSYGDSALITQPQSVLGLSNGATIMTNANFTFNNLPTVQKVLTNNYVITQVGRYTSNLTDVTKISFNDVMSKL